MPVQPVKSPVEKSALAHWPLATCTDAPKNKHKKDKYLMPEVIILLILVTISLTRPGNDLRLSFILFLKKQI